MKYNFIVIANCKKNGLYDYYNYAYKQVSELNNSIYDNYYFPKSFIAKILYRIHNSKIINKIIDLPFKEFWIKKRVNKYSTIFSSNSNICFFLFSDFIKYEKFGFSKIIRENYPNSKIVYFFQDLIEKDKNKEDFLCKYSNVADLIYSFDYDDAKKYNLKFHNIPYSDLTGLFTGVNIKYDVSFVGQAKDRLEEIISAYKALKKQNLKLGFFIIGVPKEKQVLANEIKYCDFIPYKDYLKIVAESKCMLEIMQKGGTGNTIRVSEAISLDKLLISNNQMLLQNSFYDSKYMRVYENLEELDVKTFIESNNKVHYENKEKIYPSAFFKQIEKDIDELESKKNDKKNFK